MPPMNSSRLVIDHRLIAQRLRELRKQARQSQKTLAELLGVDRRTVQRWEKLKDPHIPTVEIFARLSQLWKINFRYLVGITDTPLTIAADGIETELWGRWNRLSRNAQLSLVAMSRFLESEYGVQTSAEMREDS